MDRQGGRAAGHLGRRRRQGLGASEKVRQPLGSRQAAAAQMAYRTTTRDVECSCVRIPKHEKVAVFLGSANRDPAQWPEPDRFDVRRRAVGHMGFGTGIHACVGQMVARMAREFASIVPDGGAVRRRNNGLRGLASLPVKVGRR